MWFFLCFMFFVFFVVFLLFFVLISSLGFFFVSFHCLFDNHLNLEPCESEDFLLFAVPRSLEAVDRFPSSAADYGCFVYWSPGGGCHQLNSEQSETTHGWLQLMALGGRQCGQHRPQDNGFGSTSQTCSTSQMSSSSQSRNHSASPWPQPYQQQCPTSLPTMLTDHQDTEAKLKENCSIITYPGDVWVIPSDLEWDITFYSDSIHPFPDDWMLTWLQYWATCDTSILDMCHLLELVMACNMKFRIATRISNLGPSSCQLSQNSLNSLNIPMRLASRRNTSRTSMVALHFATSTWANLQTFWGIPKQEPSSAWDGPQHGSLSVMEVPQLYNVSWVVHQPRWLFIIGEL